MGPSPATPAIKSSTRTIPAEKMSDLGQDGGSTKCWAPQGQQQRHFFLRHFKIQCSVRMQFDLHSFYAGTKHVQILCEKKHDI